MPFSTLNEETAWEVNRTKVKKVGDQLERRDQGTSDQSFNLLCRKDFFVLYWVWAKRTIDFIIPSFIIHGTYNTSPWSHTASLPVLWFCPPTILIYQNDAWKTIVFLLYLHLLQFVCIFFVFSFACDVLQALKNAS